MTQSPVKQSFLNSLWERRFFQYLATYIAGCWGLLQFAIFGVNRYDWDGTIIERFLMMAILMLPSVCVFIYNHGRPGDDEWTRFEKFFIPINIVVALMLSIFAISSKGSTADRSSEITLTTDQGDVITRNVPNSKYTNRVVVFPFILENIDNEEQWLRYGLPVLVDAEFDQDMRFSSSSPISLGYYYQALNESLENDISTGTKLKIARELYSDYYIDGNLLKNELGYNCNFEVRRASDGSIYYENEYQGDDYFEIIDAFSDDINAKIYTREFFKDLEIVDFPTKDLITDSPEALKAYVQGLLETILKGDRSDALQGFTASIEADPNCAICYYRQAMEYNAVNEQENAKKSMKKALEKSSSLTERDRLAIRYRSYQLNQNPEKSRKLLDTWMSLYPHDSQPFLEQMQFYTIIQDRTRAIEIGERAYSNGHRGAFLKRLADLNIQIGNLEKAENYLKEFAELYPEKYKENSQLGEILLKQGKLQKALSFYEALQIKRGENHEDLIKISEIYDRLGRFSDSASAIQEAFEYANQTADSLGVYMRLRSHLLAQGRAEEAIDKYHESEVVAAQIYPQIAIDAQLYLLASGEYRQAGKMDLWLENGLKRFPDSNPQSELIQSLMQYLHAMAVENKENYIRHYAVVEPIMKKTLGDVYSNFSEGIIAKMDGAYDRAIELFELYAEETAGDYTTMQDMLCKVYLLSGKAQKSLDYAENVLEIDPHNQLFLWQAMQASYQLADTKKSKKYQLLLEKVLSKADENFVTLQELNALKLANDL